ncbi:BON domain-containing protein [Massilia sp. GCM10023247]|uniref:BON domain-containing protein n=1 Tax=Massilia sp. GCM10023247 TaxID=3252643 RepID=UPI00360EE500
MRHSKLARAAWLSAVLLAGALGGCGSVNPLAPAKPVDDAAIASKVKAAIGSNPELKSADIEVDSREGIVQLSGFVSSADSVATAASVARTVKGVKSVKNDLRLK